VRFFYVAGKIKIAATIITLTNITIPIVFKSLQNYEQHSNETGYQASLYLKICAFRWINTALVTDINTPFSATLKDQHLINAVHAIFVADIMISPALKISDWLGHIKRHILAPFAPDQDSMNKYFTGSNQMLGEKWTDMTKIIFLACYYATVFPEGYFYAAIALSLQYTVNRFGLYRSWHSLPHLGNDVTKLSRSFFFPMIMIAFAVKAFHFLSSFPFDNLCSTGDSVGNSKYEMYMGNFTAILRSNLSPISITQGMGDKVFEYCDQNVDNLFDVMESHYAWMTNEQSASSFIFGIALVIMISGLFLFAFLKEFVPGCISLFVGSYHNPEKDSGENFLDQELIAAYIPQMNYPGFLYPLFTCSIDNIDHKHIPWKDSENSYDCYSLCNDISTLFDNSEDAELILKKPIFNIAMQFLPDTAELSKVKDGSYGSLT